MAENSRKTYSLKQTAVLLGINRATLHTWLDHGAPFVRRADRARGIEWELSPADIINWRTDRAIQDALAGLDGNGEISKEEADRRRAVAQAIVAEVAADEALQAVVSREHAERDRDDFVDAIDRALKRAAVAIGPRAAVLANAAEIQSAIEDELNTAFRAARAELAAKWARDESAA